MSLPNTPDFRRESNHEPGSTLYTQCFFRLDRFFRRSRFSAQVRQNISSPERETFFALLCVKSSPLMKLPEMDQRPGALCFVVIVPSRAQNVTKTCGVFQRSRILSKHIRHTSEIMRAQFTTTQLSVCIYRVRVHQRRRGSRKRSICMSNLPYSWKISKNHRLRLIRWLAQRRGVRLEPN